MTLKSSIETLMRHQNLSAQACEEALELMLNPSDNPLQIAAFLALLRAKPETASEISAIVKALQNKMTIVPTSHRVLDIVGTGGDGMHTINISTGSAILAASCGIKIAKHGNRSVSSLTGSADVLEALGVKINLSAEQVAKCIDEVGIGFCYSPHFHATTQALRDFRKKLNLPTTFNIIGPLLNPARANYLLLGVYEQKLLPVIAEVLIQLGQTHSMVVHGTGLDEISCIGPINVCEIKQGEKYEYELDPRELGFSYCQLEDLRGGHAAMNAEILLSCFRGNLGPVADTLILNAATALYLYGSYASIKEAKQHALENLQNGAALNLLNHWIEFSHAQ